jgi:hypothetical protein
MKILLFDMDGVLLESGGYHHAFQATVNLVGRLLGYQRVKLTPQDIAAFEAAGVFSEWDSSAICAALLLENLWTEHPALTLPPTPSTPVLSAHDRSSPDFQAFAHTLTQPHLRELRPLKRAERLLLDNSRSSGSRTPGQRRAIQTILHNARQINGSLTHRIFQELVLGSPVFTETYGLPPCLDTESYLRHYDRPRLPNEVRTKLLQWLRHADHRGVIFTSRPSRAPDGGSGTPEAELGAQGLGLDALPILGLGGLTWLSARRERDAEFFLKPSPVHSLAALRLAVGDGLVDALEAAAALNLDGQADSTWQALRGAEVYAFEDGVAGLESVRAAQGTLAQIEVPIRVHLFGIADNLPKRQALEAVGATVVPSIAAALERVPRLGLALEASTADEEMQD